MTITLTREEAQQVLEHLDDLVEAQQWEIDMHITQYGEEYKPHRVKHMMERLASTNGTIEILRARLSAPESKPVAWNIKHNRPPLSSDNPHEVVAVIKSEWQGLTDEEILPDGDSVVHSYDGLVQFARAIEARLKEKNGG